MPDFAPLTPEQSDALARFQQAHGRAWKARLRSLWTTATAEPALHRLRNTHGLTWLARFAPDALALPAFTAYADPVLAVPCPICARSPGAWCVRPDGCRSVKLHAARGITADATFVERHGPGATINLVAGGRWVIDPQGRARD